MTKKEQILGHAFRLLLLLAFLQACSSSPGTQPPVDNRGSTEVAPTNTPFQPVTNTPTSALEAGTSPSATSEVAVPSLTTPSDGSSTTAAPLTILPGTPTSPPPQAPVDNPTITPDIGTASPPGDPRIEVVPKIGPIPTTHTLKIENFDQGEQVTIQVISKTTRVIIDSFVVIVDGKGGLVTYWTSKADYAMGGYFVKAIGANHGKFAIGELDIR